MATDIIGALGAGSGVDVKSLAQSLVDAEKAPREAAINTKIDDNERRIAGYSAVMLSLDVLKTAFQKLNDKTDFNAGAVTNSSPTSVNAITSASAVPGNHTVEVVTLAAKQRSTMGSFATAATALNASAPFSIQLTVGSTVQTSIRVDNTTPQGVVDAINAANQGVSASLVDTGDASLPYTIVLTGEMGASASFSADVDDGTGTGQVDTLTFGAATADGTVSVAGVSVALTAGQSAAEVAAAVKIALDASDFIGSTGRSLVDNGNGSLRLQWSAADGSVAAINFQDDDSATGATMTSATLSNVVAGSAASDIALAATPLQAAADAVAVVNGLSVTRSTNAFDDVIPGVYMDLLAVNTGAPADVRVTRDTTAIKDNINAVVQAYNDAISDFAILTGARSEDEDDIYSGSLAGDSTMRTIKNQLRAMMLGDSSTPGAAMTAMRDIGLDIDRTGVISMDATKLDTALNNDFEGVVTMFSADTTNQSAYGTASRGIAGDAIKSLTDLIDTRGTIASQSSNAQSRIDDYQEVLDKLNTRMEALLARYTKQFAIMESIVGQSNSMRDGLKSTFDGMMAMYTNN